MNVKYLKVLEGTPYTARVYRDYAGDLIVEVTRPSHEGKTLDTELIGTEYISDPATISDVETRIRNIIKRDVPNITGVYVGKTNEKEIYLND